MNWRQEARCWYKKVHDKYILVGEPFSLLGYSSLEDECRRNGGLVKDDDIHTEIERNCFSILEDTCKKLFADFFIADPWPSHKIITNPKATYHGMATVCKNKRKQFNKMHLCIKNKIDCVYLKRSIIEADKFYDGLSTYVHEMSHMFGGDASENFSLGLTLAMEILLQNTAIVESAHQKWRQQFSNNSQI
jgi:phosphorylcholine metabolism protein LicD